MNKRIRLVVAAAAVVGGFTVSQAGAVSAAHCVAPAGEPSSPGFSYFGSDHVCVHSSSWMLVTSSSPPRIGTD